MKVVDAKIIGTDTEGNTTEDFFFTYSEEEKQENEINKEYSNLIFNWNYLTIPREIFDLGLSGNDAIILAFISTYRGRNNRFYFSNEQLSSMFNLSPVGISKILKKLSDKKLIDLSYKRKASGGQIRFVKLSPTNTFYKYQLKQSISSNLNNVYGNNNINNNNINNNPKGLQNFSNSDRIVGGSKPKVTRSNKSIDYTINTFKEKFNLPVLDGSVQENRRYAQLLLNKFGGEVKLTELIELASCDDFWATKLASLKMLYNHAVEIISKTRTKQKIVIV